jgi:hypothetical protein
MRFMIKALLIGSFCLTACAALWTTPVLGDELTSGEIRAELVGRSIGWWEQGGWFQGHILFSPDGSAEITVDRPEMTGDRGRWFIKGNELCTEWGEIRAAEKCYTIERGSEGRFVTSGGNIFEIRETGV